MNKSIGAVKTRMCAIILIFAMCMSLIPSTAFASEEDKGYAPGEWIGAGQGFKAKDNPEGTTPFPGEATVKVKVKIENQNGVNKITAIDVIEFRDDSKPYGLFAKGIIPFIIENNGVEEVKKSIADKDTTAGTPYDAVSSATFSAVGIIEAVENALEDSKRVGSGEESQIAYYELDEASQLPKKVEYGEPISLDGVVLKAVYGDASKNNKKISYKDFQAEGISVNKPNNFTIESENPVHSVRLLFSKEGMLKLGQDITGEKKGDNTRFIKQIKIILDDNQEIEVEGDNTNFVYDLVIPKGVSSKIKSIELTDNKGNNPQVISWNETADGKNLYIYVGNAPEPDVYSFTTYRLEIKDENIDDDTITKFSLKAKPNKVVYNVGEKISFDGLKVEYGKGGNNPVIKNNVDWLDDEGIKTSISEGELFTSDQVGSQKITLTLPEDAKVAHTSREISFDVEVKEKNEIVNPPSYVIINLLYNGQEYELARVDLKSGENVYSKAGWLLGAQYRDSKDLKFHVYSDDGNEIEQNEVKTDQLRKISEYKPGVIAKIYFKQEFENFNSIGGQSYLFLGMMDPPIPNKIKLYAGDYETVVAEEKFDIQNGIGVNIEVPAKYKNQVLKSKIFGIDQFGRDVEIPLNDNKTIRKPTFQKLYINGTGKENGYKDYYEELAGGMIMAFIKVKPEPMTDFVTIQGKKVYYKESTTDLDFTVNGEPVEALRIEGTNLYYYLPDTFETNMYGTSSMSFQEYWKNEGLTSPSDKNFVDSYEGTDKEGEYDLGGFDAITRATNKHGIFRLAFQFLTKVNGKDQSGNNLSLMAEHQGGIKNGQLYAFARPNKPEDVLVIQDGESTFSSGNKKYSITDYEVLGYQMIPVKVKTKDYVEATILENVGKGNEATKVFAKFNPEGRLMNNLEYGKVVVNNQTGGIKTLNSDGTYSASQQSLNSHSAIGYNVSSSKVINSYETESGSYVDAHIYLEKEDGTQLSKQEFLNYITNYTGAKYEYFGDDDEMSGNPIGTYGSKPIQDTWWSSEDENKIDVGFLFDALRFGGAGNSGEPKIGTWKVTLRSSNFNDVEAKVVIKDNHTIEIKPEASIVKDENKIKTSNLSEEIISVLTDSKTVAYLEYLDRDGRYQRVKTFENNKNGEYDISDIDISGKYRLVIETNKYSDQIMYIDNTPSLEIKNEQKLLEVKSDSSGYVNAINNNAAAKIMKYVETSNGLELREVGDASNNMDRTFTIADLKTGEYILAIFADNYPVNYIPFNVVDKPLINKEPESVNTFVNMKEQFLFVGATGENLKYQWQKTNKNNEFEDVAGANAKKLGINTNEYYNGKYRVIVSNQAGSILSQEVVVKVEKEYKIIEGNDQIIRNDSNEDVIFKSDGELSDFVSVEIDNKVISAEDYVKTEGSTILTFKSSFMKKLGKGDHNIRFNFSDGYATGRFTVEKSTNENIGTGGSVTIVNDNVKTNAPRTGDKNPLALYFMVATLLLIWGGLVFKNRNSRE